MKKDVLLLADVFENFIDTCLKLYGLDPCHYFSFAGLSWDAMFKLTSVRLEKIVDIDIYLFIEKWLRGGISYIAKRYSKWNNKYMKNYDPKKPSKFITYLDMSDNDNDNDNEFISAYPFYMKLALRPKIIYTKKEILCNEIPWNN